MSDSSDPTCAYRRIAADHRKHRTTAPPPGPACFPIPREARTRSAAISWSNLALFHASDHDARADSGGFAIPTTQGEKMLGPENPWVILVSTRSRVRLRRVPSLAQASIRDKGATRQSVAAICRVPPFLPLFWRTALHLARPRQSEPRPIDRGMPPRRQAVKVTAL